MSINMSTEKPMPFMRPARDLEGRVAIVTGSTSGIGLAIATELATRGAAIVINGLGNRDEILDRCHDMSAMHDVAVEYDDADMSNGLAIAGMMQRTAATLGATDILVNNAGIQHVAPVDTFPPEKWDAIIAINLSAAFHTIRAAIPAMRQAGWGRIINVASAHGLIGSPFKSAYVAAKHGIVGLTKVVALETAEHGITCNAVCPGYVFTPLVEKQIEAQAIAHNLSKEDVVAKVLLAEQPNKRFATVEEMAGIVAFLCTPAAASITGTTIAADGGWTAH